MRFHHFEGHDDDGLFIDLDHVRTICEDGTREGYAIVHTDRTAFLVKGDYREIAKLVMAKAMLGGFADIDKVAVAGTPERVVAGLREKMARGVTDFAVMFGDLGLDETLELFARDVMPALR